jgi:hypothetical protein
MDLFACGTMGTHACCMDGFTEWEDVLRLAKEQSVYFTVLYAIKRMPACNVEQTRINELFSELKTIAVSSFARRIMTMKLLKEFESSGMRAVLLKGYAIAALYDSPDSRISGDIDIYIDAKDEKKAQNFLREHGFEVLPRDKRSHHAICLHPEMGYLELHTSLYDEIVADVWFRQRGKQKFIEEPFEKITIEDGTYYTLGQTDNLIFLALHMIKHFIENGMSLRLIMDLALTYRANKEEQNLLRFWQVMEQLEYAYFIKTVLCIANEFLHLSIQHIPDCTEVKKQDIMAVLDDLETGGWLGYNDKASRDEGWYEYNRQKLTNDRGRIGYYVYMNRWNIKGYFRAIFPPRTILAYRFPYVQRSIFLVPVAWVHRAVSRGFTYVLQGKMSAFTIQNENKLSDVARKRIALFRQIKMI